MSGLLGLYDSILVVIFAKWIDIDDFGILDSALCNLKMRSVFLALISKKYFVHCNASFHRSDEYYSWLMMRKIQVTDLVVPLICSREFEQSCLFKNNMIFRNLEISCTNLAKYADIIDKIDSVTLVGDVKSVLSELFTIIKIKYVAMKSLNLTSALISESHFTEIIPILTLLTDLESYKGPYTTSCTNLSKELKCFSWYNHKMEHYSETLLNKIVSSHQFIEKLDLSLRYQVSDSGLLIIGSNLPRLKSFTTGCNDISDAGLGKFVKSCKLLECLVLWQATNITDVGMASVANNLTCLKEFWVTTTRHAVTSELALLLMNNKQLTKLCLEQCRMITDMIIFAIATECKQLTALGLGKCPNLTSIFIPHLQSECKQLQRVNFNGLAESLKMYIPLTKGSDEIVLNGKEDHTTIPLQMRVVRGNLKRVIWHTAKRKNETGGDYTHTLTADYLHSVAILSPKLQTVRYYNYSSVDYNIFSQLLVCPLVKTVEFRGCGDVPKDLIAVMTNRRIKVIIA